MLDKNILLLIIIFIIISQFDLKYILLILPILYFIYIYYNNIDIGGKLAYSETLNIIEKYKSINNTEFSQGLKMWKLFISLTSKINNDMRSLEYDKAEKYLDTSINHFKSLIILKNNDDYNELSNEIDKLYKEGFIILKKISIKLNNNWEKHPNSSEKEIVFGEPKPHNWGKF